VGGDEVQGVKAGANFSGDLLQVKRVMALALF
jgi:hypothetical protein